MKNETRSRFRRVLRALDLPEEVDLNVPKFTMLGNTDLLVENHRGILQYNEGLIRLVTADGVVRITGTGLELTEFGSERVLVRGALNGWCFEGRGGCGIP